MISQFEIDFRVLFESAPGLYLILLPDLTIVAASDSYLDATMTKRTDILGKNLFDIFPDNPDDSTASGVLNLRASLNYVIQYGVSHTMAVQKYDIRRPDGAFEERFWSPLNKPVFNADKELAWIIHRVEDVTDFIRLKKEEVKQLELTNDLRTRVDEMKIETYKRAQEIQQINKKLLNEMEERRKSEEKFRSLLEAAPDAMVITNKKGEIVLINRQAEILFGYTKDELSNQMVEVLVPFLFRDKHLHHRSGYYKDPKLRAMGEGFELYALRKDGSQFPVEISLSPLEISEDILVSAAIRDISARKEAEEKIRLLNMELEKKVVEKTKEVIEKEQQYRFLLENMREGIQVIGYDWRYRFVNNSIINQSKYSKGDLLGYTMMEKYPGLQNTGLFKTLERCMNERIPELLENEFTFPDGSKEWFELSIQPIPEGLFILSMDITNRKKAEEKLKRYAEELKNSNTELERFAYVASHDLQEPLRMISSFLNLLEEKIGGQLDDAGKQYMHFILDGADRMKSLIQSLLQYSRIGNNKENFAQTDLNEVMTYVFRLLEETIKETRALITACPLPIIIANKPLINLLFINLVNNALKYHGNKDPQIEIGYTEQSGQYTFYVKDNGIGIDPKFFEKIFIIFQRLHNKNEYSGTGIGLAICKKIVEIHQGKIWVESRIKQGSTFYFTIPKSHT